GYTAQEREQLQAAYEESIAYEDHEVGELLAELRKGGALENTLVIVASDHGEGFGEHGLMEHGHSVYAELIKVPLVMSFASRIPAGRRLSRVASLRDIPATIVDLIGLKSESPFPGTSLARRWDSQPSTPAPERPAALAEAWPSSDPDSAIQSVVTDRMQYVR